MALKTFKPTSPGQRHVVIVNRDGLWKGKPVKSLTEGLTKSGGRGKDGRINARHRGGGHKRTYRLIDFKRRKFDVAGNCRTAGIRSQPDRLYRAHPLCRWRAIVHSGAAAAESRRQRRGRPKCRREAGQRDADGQHAGRHDRAQYRAEARQGRAAARSAGSYAQLAGRDQGYVILKLKSGETRLALADCMATVGAVSNPDHLNEVVGKAGRSRWRGVRPQTRGIAMNPIDHPNGGRTNGGKHWATPWGKPTKGKKTRSNKATDKYIVRSRHLRKK